MVPYEHSPHVVCTVTVSCHSNYSKLLRTIPILVTCYTVNDHVLLGTIQDAAGNPKDVFLYNKAHLKANVQLPEPEDIAVPHANGKLLRLLLNLPETCWHSLLLSSADHTEGGMMQCFCVATVCLATQSNHDGGHAYRTCPSTMSVMPSGPAHAMLCTKIAYMLH